MSQGRKIITAKGIEICEWDDVRVSGKVVSEERTKVNGLCGVVGACCEEERCFKVWPTDEHEHSIVFYDGKLWFDADDPNLEVEVCQ